jgi:hypothetical protein
MEPEGLLPPSQESTNSSILSQINSVHVPHPTYWRTILILPSHLGMGLPSGLFTSDFPTETLYASVLYPYVLHAPPLSFFSFEHSNKIWWGVQIIKLLIKNNKLKDDNT